MVRVLAGDSDSIAGPPLLALDGASDNRKPPPATVVASRAEGTVSQFTFAACWWLIALYHVINGFFILLIGAVQLHLSIPEVYTTVYLIQIDINILRVAGATTIAIALVHLIALLINILQSARRCQLSFGYDGVAKKSSRSVSSTGQSLVHRLLRVLLSPLRRVRELFGDDGMFGVNGDYFYLGFYARQVIEIILQTNQAQQLSRSVQTESINDFMISVIIVNCAFVPVVTLFMKKHPAGCRAILLTLDIALDFLVLVVVPIMALRPILGQYDWIGGSFPATLTYDDVWLTNSVATVRFVLVSTLIDFLSTVFPHVSCLVTLDTIKGLLHRRSAQEKHKQQPNTKQLAETTRIFAMKARALRCFCVFASAWAIFVIVCHTVAKNQSASAEVSQVCGLRVKSWLASKPTCSVVLINCHRLNISGTETELSSILDQVEPTTISRFAISHCPAVTVPSVVTKFENLLGFELFNSTLVEWRPDAALTRHSTPRLNQLHFLATNFSTTFPAAVVTSQLPSLLGMLVYQSNSTEIPDEFSGQWQSQIWSYFSLQYTNIVSLPPSFQHLQAYRVTLIGSQLTSVPADAFSPVPLLALRVSCTNVTSLPKLAGDMTTLSEVVAENTSIASLPAWFIDWHASKKATKEAIIVSFNGSPVCDDAKNEEICEALPVEVAGDFRFDIHQLGRLW